MKKKSIIIKIKRRSFLRRVYFTKKTKEDAYKLK
jgi:hypothetical protein